MDQHSQTKSANLMVGPARLTDNQVALQQKSLRMRSVSALPSFHDAGAHTVAGSHSLKAPDMMQVADMVEHFVAVNSSPSALSVKKFPPPSVQHVVAESTPAMAACSPQDLSWRFKSELAAAPAVCAMADRGFFGHENDDDHEEEDEELVALTAVREFRSRISGVALLRCDADGVSKQLSGEWHFADSDEVQICRPRDSVCVYLQNVMRITCIDNVLKWNHNGWFVSSAQDAHLPTFTSDIF